MAEYSLVKTVNVRYSIMASDVFVIMEETEAVTYYGYNFIEQKRDVRVRISSAIVCTIQDIRKDVLLLLCRILHAVFV